MVTTLRVVSALLAKVLSVYRVRTVNLHVRILHTWDDYLYRSARNRLGVVEVGWYSTQFAITMYAAYTY